VFTRKLCAARFGLLGHRWFSPDIEVPGSAAADRHDSEAPYPAAVRAGDLPADRPVAASPDTCLARTRDGEIFRFRRYCPHQGADLSLGRLIDDQVVCPWHNLPFDLRSGQAACSAVGSLRSKPCEVHEGLVRVRPEHG
jgi:nitrite reductase/ring-hydroxylating ferredoxin subunit